jgi:hypothetical protein
LLNPRLLLVPLVLFFLLLACSDDEEVFPAPEPTDEAAAPSPTPEVTPTLRPVPQADPLPPNLQALADSVLKQTTAIRGLDPKGPITLLSISRTEVVDYLLGGYDQPDRRKAMELRQEVYQLLGLIPPTTNLLQLALEAFSEPFVLAFYDPDARAIFLFDEQLNSTGAFLRYVLSHEFTHALQDQYYDLNRVYEETLFDWDAGFAFAALLEGDARDVDLTYLREEISSAEAATLLRDFASLPTLSPATYPAVIIRELIWPYDAGAAFLRSAAPRHGGLNGIYSRRPITTEQVIHPEKYPDEGARPVDLLSLTGALGAGWQELGSANLGEFTWQNVLLLGQNNTNATRAAAGWGGDRWRLYGRESAAHPEALEGRLFHLGVTWDSTAEAQEFWSIFVASLQARGGSLQLGEGNLTWQSGGRTLRAALAGDTVTLLIANDVGALANASRALGWP